MESKKYTAIVQKTIPNGEHGPYAVASSEDLGIITFSLKPPVWQEKDWPEGGHIVVLSEIRRKRAGWQANSGRFYEPSDDQPTNQKHQHQKQKGAPE